MLGAGHKHNCGNSHGSNLCRSNGCYCCLPAHRLQRRLRRHRGGLLPDPRLPADGHRRHRLLCNSLLSLQSERRPRIEEGFCSCPLGRWPGSGYSIHSKKITKISHFPSGTGCLGGRQTQPLCKSREKQVAKSPSLNTLPAPHLPLEPGRETF